MIKVRKVYFIIILLITSVSLIGHSAPTSKLTLQKQAVEKYLRSKNSFEKKAKIILLFKNWADKEVLSNSDKLNEEDLTLVMQFSNLLKALNPAKLNLKNCSNSIDAVLEEDLTPLSEKPSAPALTILSWLKIICIKG